MQLSRLMASFYRFLRDKGIIPTLIQRKVTNLKRLWILLLNSNDLQSEVNELKNIISDLKTENEYIYFRLNYLEKNKKTASLLPPPKEKEILGR